MSDAQVFTNNELAVNVRVEGGDDPWFVAKALTQDKLLKIISDTS